MLSALLTTFSASTSATAVSAKESVRLQPLWARHAAGRCEGSAAPSKNLHQLLRRNNFELSVSAVTRLLVGAPPAKLRHVTEPGPLHVLVSDFHHKFGPQR